MKTQWSSQSPARTGNNSPPTGKTTITAERTQFSYLSSSFLPMNSRLPQVGHGYVNPPGHSTSAQCNGELTSNSQQIAALAYASSTTHKYKPETGKFSSPLISRMQTITQDMNYAHTADSQVFLIVHEYVCIKRVQFIPSSQPLLIGHVFQCLHGFCGSALDSLQ